MPPEGQAKTNTNVHAHHYKLLLPTGVSICGMITRIYPFQRKQVIPITRKEKVSRLKTPYNETQCMPTSPGQLNLHFKPPQVNCYLTTLGSNKGLPKWKKKTPNCIASEVSPGKKINKKKNNFQPQPKTTPYNVRL